MLLRSFVMVERPAPSPPYSGERVGVRGEGADASSCDACKTGPSPQPSPLSTGERGPMHRQIGGARRLHVAEEFFLL